MIRILDLSSQSNPAWVQSILEYYSTMRMYRCSIPKFHLPILTKSGYVSYLLNSDVNFIKVRNTTVETQVSINIEDEQNTSSLMFEFPHFGNPYSTISNICLDRTTNQDFIRSMSCREEEVQHFLLTYYNSNTILKYSVLDQLCGIRPTDVDEKIEEWSFYNNFLFPGS